MKKNYLSIAIGLSLLAGVAEAQQSGATDVTADSKANALDTVTVTARRRVESIQDVPIAVTVFSQEDLRDLQASNIDGLQGSVPNLNIVQGGGSSNSINVYIRGIGQPDALQTFDPGVGMYVDDVYYSRVQGALFSLYDVQQVEVLRGPQGTLYGKNTTGGAIKIVTKNPFEDEGGSVDLILGNFGRAEGRVYSSAKFSETFAGSISAGLITNDGYVTDPLTGKSYNDEDTRVIRGKLAFMPSETFNANLVLDYTRQDNAMTLGQAVGPLYAYDVGTGYAQIRPAPVGEYDFKTSTSIDPANGQEMTHQGISLTMNWTLDSHWELKSISAYRTLDTDSYMDLDASEYRLGDNYVRFEQSQLSQELQLHYNNGGNFEAIFGLYYLDESIPSHQETNSDDFLIFGPFSFTSMRTIDDELDNKSLAFFVDGSWVLQDDWTLFAGVRYTKDSKDYYRTTSTFSDFFGNFDPESTFTASGDWSAWTPTVSIQKAFSKTKMGYFSASRGFKSGGFNGRSNVLPETYKPEYVWTYEAGLKLQSTDRNYSGRFAIFHSTYEDFQARVSEVQNPQNALPIFAFPVLNAEQITINGFEFEGVARVGEDTTLTGQLGWLDAEYGKFTDPRPGVNHDHVPFSPELTARIAVQHSFDLASGARISFGGDVSYRSETWLSVDNVAGLSQDAYALLGLYGHWDSSDSKWHVRIGVRNLTDEVYKLEGQEFSSIGGIQTAYFGMPRNYYVNFRMDF